MSRGALHVQPPAVVLLKIYSLNKGRHPPKVYSALLKLMLSDPLGAESSIIISLIVWPWNEWERCKQLARFVLTRTKKSKGHYGQPLLLPQHTFTMSLNTMAGHRFLAVHAQHMCPFISAMTPMTPCIPQEYFQHMAIIHYTHEGKLTGLVFGIISV